MNYLEITKNYMKLKALHRARIKFNKTFAFIYGEMAYIPPRQISEFYWQFCLENFCVEGETETECYIEMKKLLEEEKRRMSSYVDWSCGKGLKDADEFPF